LVWKAPTPKEAALMDSTHLAMGQEEVGTVWPEEE